MTKIFKEQAVKSGNLNLDVFQDVCMWFADVIADRLATKVTEMIRDNQPKTYNRDEVAQLLHVTVQTLGTYIKQGKLTPLNTEKGRGQLFDAQEVEFAIGTGKVRRFGRTYNG